MVYKKQTLIHNITTNHQALQRLFNPNRSITKSTAAAVQRWSIALAAYNHDIVHRLGKSIAQADFISRYSIFSPSASRDDLLKFSSYVTNGERIATGGYSHIKKSSAYNQMGYCIGEVGLVIPPNFANQFSMNCTRTILGWRR